MGTSMTHDELRDYIDRFDAAGMIYEPAIQTIRAIVELHQPDQSGLCEWCTCRDCTHMVSYPCKTIKKIVLELK
tara:strand:+ start:7210 stop:7431 length:222 start_codon:yes stop_codon:yes gene_type:complete